MVLFLLFIYLFGTSAGFAYGYGFPTKSVENVIKQHVPLKTVQPISISFFFSVFVITIIVKNTQRKWEDTF